MAHDKCLIGGSVSGSDGSLGHMSLPVGLVQGKGKEWAVDDGGEEDADGDGEDSPGEDDGGD